MAADLARFNADLSKFEQTLAGRQDELVKNVALALANEVMVGGDFSPGTPVDTGFALNSWVVGINAIAAPRQPPTPPSTSFKLPVVVTTRPAAITAAMEAKLGDEVYVTSNCEYIEELEKGHSKQAPVGMVRITVAAGPLIVEREAAKLIAAGAAGGTAGGATPTPPTPGAP